MGILSAQSAGHHVHAVPTEARRGHQVSGPLESELQMVVRYHVGAGNEPVSFGRATNILTTKPFSHHK